MKKIEAKSQQEHINVMPINMKLRSILITGPPGIGKTTLVKKIYAKLKEENNIQCFGFYTEEVRENQGRGRRLGFDIVSLTGLRANLARESQADSKGPMVGKYLVCLSAFESIALPLLKGYDFKTLLVVDEIGKMELKSKQFLSLITGLKDKASILATIPLKTAGPVSIIEDFKRSSSSKVFHVTLQNRNDLVDEIIKYIKTMEIK